MVNTNLTVIVYVSVFFEFIDEIDYFVKAEMPPPPTFSEFHRTIYGKIIELEIFLFYFFVYFFGKHARIVDVKECFSVALNRKDKRGAGVVVFRWNGRYRIPCTLEAFPRF